MKVAINRCIIDINSPKEEVSKEQHIAELKQKLEDTDYVACKIAEGVATKEEYAEVIVQRQEWRQEINKLENEISATSIQN